MTHYCPSKWLIRTFFEVKKYFWKTTWKRNPEINKETVFERNYYAREKKYATSTFGLKMTVIDPKISTNFSIIRGKYSTLAIFVSMFLKKYILSKPILLSRIPCGGNTYPGDIRIKRKRYKLYQSLSCEKCWHWKFFCQCVYSDLNIG